MTSLSTSQSPADAVQELILAAHWRAYEEERERFLNERHEAMARAGLIHGLRRTFVREKKLGINPCDLCWEANAAYFTARRRANGGRAIPERGENFTHGTLYGYSVIKCRCELCDARGTARNAKWKQKQKEMRRAMKEEDLRTGLYPVIETTKKEEPPKDIKRPLDIVEEHQRLEDLG